MKSKLFDSTIMDNPNFRVWFKGSKIVDQNGQPLIVYHGSQEEFIKFKGDTYFTDDWNNADGYAGGKYVYEVYLSIKNPLVVDAKGKKWDDLDEPYLSTQNSVDMLDRKKYDGVIINNVKDSWIDDADYQDPSTIYVAIDPTQMFWI